MSPRFSPARPACSSSSLIPSAASRGCAKASTTTCRRRPSTWSAPSSRPWRRARSWRRKRRSGNLIMATFHFDLVSPEKLLFSGEVTQVDLPGEEGEFGVLAEHAPYIATLKPGVLTIYRDGSQQRVVVRGGFAEVAPGGNLTVPAEQAVP